MGASCEVLHPVESGAGAGAGVGVEGVAAANQSKTQNWILEEGFQGFGPLDLACCRPDGNWDWDRDALTENETERKEQDRK